MRDKKRIYELNQEYLEVIKEKLRQEGQSANNTKAARYAVEQTFKQIKQK